MKNQIIKKYNRPVFFFGLSLLIPWVLWFSVAYLSNLLEQSSSLIFIQALLAILGLLAPTFVAAYLFLSDKELFSDLKKRFIRHKGFSPIYILLAFTLIFVSIIVAQLISLLFGHSIDQFYISGSPSFTSALLSPWFILLFAPVVEELAWHTYGTDALRQRFNLFTTCMIFSLYWAFWHLPLSFIDGYYHSNVVEEGFLYSLNYVFSLFVFVIFVNWLHYRTSWDIFITIILINGALGSLSIFAIQLAKDYSGKVTVVCS